MSLTKPLVVVPGRSRPSPRPSPRPTQAAWPLLALCLLGAPGLAEEAAAGREAMADAMSRMMSAMGLLGQSAAGAQAPGGVMPPVGAGVLEQAGEAGRRLMEGAGQAVGSGGLDGLWEASGGGLLIVEGGHYRLYAPYGGYVDGDIQVTGTRVQMSSRRAGFNLDFEYALDQGRLAMRDARGQVYLYRRMVLTGGG